MITSFFLNEIFLRIKDSTQDRIAQWISAFDFGSKGRGFDSHCGRQ